VMVAQVRVLAPVRALALALGLALALVPWRRRLAPGEASLASVLLSTFS